MEILGVGFRRVRNGSYKPVMAMENEQAKLYFSLYSLSSMFPINVLCRGISCMSLESMGVWESLVWVSGE